MSGIDKLSGSKAFVKFTSNLTSGEKEKVVALLQRYINQNSSAHNNERLRAENEVQEVNKECNRYMGFYWTIQGEIERYNLTPEHIDGINEGLEYLKKRPDQIIQHYQDPNPTEKVIQHRRDR